MELGTHSQLMEKQGVYHTLVTMQVTYTHLKILHHLVGLELKGNFVFSGWSVFDILFVSVVSSRLSLPQTFQQVEEGEEADHELSAEEKSPLVRSLSHSPLQRRKSTRGSSFAVSEGEKKEKEKSLQDITEEVSCELRGSLRSI